MNMKDFEISLENKDKRGSVYCGKMNGEEQFLVAEIKKGSKRGGHYHNIDTFHFVLIGNIKYFETQLEPNGEKSKNQNEIKKSVRGGTLIPTPAYAAHMVEAIEDSIIIEPAPKEKRTIDFIPYRKLVVG